MVDNTILIRFIFITVIPIIIMFALERFVFLKLTRNPKGIAWVRSKFWLHPNFISRCRYPMGLVSVIIYHLGTILYPEARQSFLHHLSIFWFSFWIISDITDGTIARHCDLHTKEGESIDPLSDKLLIFPPLFYFAYLDLISVWLVLLFLIFDTIGQFSRLFISHTAANLFGKAKTFLAVITIVLITIQQVYFPEIPLGISKVIFLGTVFLAFCSVFFKIIPNFWYANILSMLNLVCGIGGIILVVFFGRPGLAFALVFLGQFLDMFDGRAAERWGSTPLGGFLDDLADGTNFGGTISFIIWFSFNKNPLGLILGATHMGSTIYRLIRFIRDKKNDGIEGGVEVFHGLPSPAAALIAGSAALIETNNYLRMGFIILSAFLMISKIPYIHFGRVILPSIPKMVKVMLLTLILLAVLIGFSRWDHQVLYWIVFACSFGYLIFGYSWKKQKNTKPT